MDDITIKLIKENVELNEKTLKKFNDKLKKWLQDHINFFNDAFKNLQKAAETAKCKHQFSLFQQKCGTQINYKFYKCKFCNEAIPEWDIIV